MKRTTVAVLTAILVSLACDGTTEPTPFVAPTIDGVQSAGEWDEATAVVFGDATFFYVNDDANLYLALDIPDPTLGADDWMAVQFDNQQNGVLDENEDHLLVRGDQALFDYHWSAGVWGTIDGEGNLEGAAGNDGEHNFFEMEHPLNSGDPHDFALSSGDRVDYCVYVRKNGSTSAANVFPTGCLAAGDDLSSYAEIIVN